MTDDEPVKIAPREQAPEQRYGETLLYDFAKFLITLPLLVLGAMLTLSQAAKDGDIKLFNIVLVLTALSVTAVMAFSVANSLVDARARGAEPPGYLPATLKFATALFGVGVGGFLMLWIDTLS